MNLIAFFSGDRLISSTTVFLPSLRILNTELEISSSLIALLTSSPGENFKLSKKTCSNHSWIYNTNSNITI